MPIKHRSIQLTSSGVKKAEAKLSNDFKARSRALEVVSKNTLTSLLTPEPVLANTARRVFDCLTLILEDTDWEPVSQRRTGGDEANPQECCLTSCASFPLSECMERIAQGSQVSFLSTWLVNKESLAQLLVGSAFERSGETRILILDPRSVHVACRGIDLISSKLAAVEGSDGIKAAEKNAKAKVQADVKNSLREISDLAPYRQNDERLKVRVYDSTPTMTLLIVDGYVCQGFHWRDHQGSSKPHIEYTQEQNSLLYQAVMDHFNAIWNSRTTYLYDVAERVIKRER